MCVCIMCVYVPWQGAPRQGGLPPELEIKVVRTTILLAIESLLYEGTLRCIIEWIC